MSTTLFTIGFTRKGAQRFFEMIKAAKVRVLLDIRAHPDSQLAGFARGKDLAWLLQQLCATDYLRVPALAPTRSLLGDYRKGTVDWRQYEARYLGELEPARIDEQLRGIDLERTCLLCAEDTPEQCHRRLAAEWLQQRNTGLIIKHLV